jgi:glutamate 5-kinase
MCNTRIVVRIEISTLSNPNGKFDHRKMDRLAMVLSNLNNSGRQLLLVTSGAIALGSDKLNLTKQPQSAIDMQVAAAIGQAELIRFYQYYFDHYNQIVAQILLTSDILDNEIRVTNARNTFETLMGMNIIPIINENDIISTEDIELDDNYPLALSVAKIANADIILIKMDTKSNFIIQPRGGLQPRFVSDENQLIEELSKIEYEIQHLNSNDFTFPVTIEEIVVNQ